MRKQTIIILLIFVAIILVSFDNAPFLPDKSNENYLQVVDIQPESLKDTLGRIVAESPGEIGIAIIYENRDTIVLNDEPKYPMMSVFKLHQGIATCNYMSERGISLDSTVRIPRSHLNPDTWSPMLKNSPSGDLSISYRSLLRYAIEESDNNASNYLFENMLDPKSVDTHIASYIPRNGFQIIYSEADMLNNHTLAYANHTSPLAAASLINLLYTDARFENVVFVKECLDNCRTGRDRIVAPLTEEIGVKVSHKTGSGFRDAGILAAHNDVAFVRLPDGRHYSLAVFVKDFPGSEAEASAVIARISDAVYKAAIEQHP